MARVVLHTPLTSNPRPIGWLSQVGDNLRVSFDDDYVEDPQRPTLSQLYRADTEQDTRQILRAVNDERLVRIGRLPSFFSNLLPEGHNRTRLAERRGVDESDELELLAAAGHDLSGAVVILPAKDIPQDVLELHATKGLEPVEAGTVAAPMDDGFSVDGVQTKFSAVLSGRRYILRHGTAAGEFIAKLPSTKYPDLVSNEATCYGLAAAVGIATAHAVARPIAELNVPEAVKSEFSEFLLVPRFDRRVLPDGTTGRVHFEELTQAIGLDARNKYRRMDDAMRALLVILKTSDAPIDDFDEFFRRWTAYSLMGNTDAHSKNWGFCYPDGRNARLAPAYDIVSVASYFTDGQPNELAMNRAMDKSLRAWGEDAAEGMAKSAGFLNFNRARRIVRETRARAAAAWPAMLVNAPPRVRGTVTARLREMVPAQPKAAARPTRSKP